MFKYNDRRYAFICWVLIKKMEKEDGKTFVKICSFISPYKRTAVPPKYNSGYIIFTLSPRINWIYISNIHRLAKLMDITCTIDEVEPIIY